MSKNNFQERLRKMEDTKQRFSIRKFSIGAASVLIGLTIFGMGNETVHAAEQPAQNQNGGVQTSAVNKEESDASKAKQEAETSVNVNSEVTENMQEVSVDQKANTAQLEKKAPASAVKEEKTVADPTPAKEQNATSKQDSASAQTSQPAVDSVKQNAKKTQQVGNDKAALATTITLNEPKSSVVELTESKATVQDENSTTVVTSAKELIDAIQKGTANTINIGANIDFSYSSYTNTNISNKRNIIIQSVAGKHCTVDFNGYGFNMYSSDYGVTFKNLDLYGRSYYGIVRSAGSYTFDNVNYTGAELIYTDPGYNTTVNFDGNVTAHSVGSYTAPLNGKLRLCQGGNNQQVIQFADGKNTINFNSGSDVTLTTTNSNVVEVDKGTTTINVKNGAQVSLNPHTQIFTEQHRMRMDGIARGIASNGDDTTLNIDQDGNLDINLTKNINGLFSSDKYLSGALYLNSGATINVNGNLNINSNGKPYYRSQGWDDPVYINGKATINVNGGSFKVNATNMGDYKGSIVTSNGNTTIAINHHGTFDVTGDGAKATGVSLGNGSTFTSTQPELFNISMPDGATAIAIKNGKVQFNGVKTSADSHPIGKIDITYKDGIPKVTTVTSYDETTTTATRTAVYKAVYKAKNKINLVAAGKEVDLKDIMFTKDADGNYIMSGNANTADNNGAYVYISVNGTVHQVAPTDSQTLYTVGPTGGPTSSQVPYTAETGADGEFRVNLGKLKDTDQVSLYAAKDFVTSDKDTKTVSEWMTSFYRDQLQKLVDEAPTVEGGSNYINATDSLKTAYANAISDGSAFLQNPSATSEQLEAAATAITTAKTALNGDLNKVKQALEAAVKDAPNVRNTPAYYNAASAKQQAYNTAISDGSEALKAQNPTVESLTDALNKINEAKSALDGKATDTSKLKAAVDNANTVKASNDYKDASADDQKQYDDAVKAGQQLLDPTTAPSPLTQADVDRAAKAITDAQSALTTSATTNVKDAKGKATADLTNAVDAAKKAIDQDTNLTEDERNAAKAQVDSDASAAKEAINKATTNDAVTYAATAGKVTIDKTVANAAIDNAAAGRNKAIDGSSLTDEEKNGIKDQVAQAVKTAKDIISAADTEQAVTTAQKNGVAAIDGIKVSANSTAKDQAKSNITDAADKAKQTIDQDNNLTNDQKQAAKAQVDADAKTAQEAINKATTNDDVTSATNTGKLAIDKAVANAAIDNAVAGKKAEISNAKDLSSDDVKALNDEVDQAANDAKNAISSATTEKAVKTAQTDGVDKINAIDVATTAAKDKAKSDIDQTANDAKKAIDDNKDLTDDQKTAAKDQIDQDATKAKDNINNAKTDKDVEDANNAGQLAIAKDGAKAAIQGALNKKLNEIDSASALTSDEKAKLTNDANTAATNANKAIDAATTPIEVTSAQTAGIQDIENVKVPAESTTKDQAKSNITDAADKAKQTIDQDNNLTNDQKQAAKAQVDTDAKNAQDAIDNAKTDADVNNAADNGKIAIDKTVADAAIDNAVAGKIKDVKAPLTTDEQKTLTDLIKETGENAKQNIANATTPAEVTTAQDAGVNAIDQINVPTTSPVKDAADKAIDEALKNKTAAINKAANITDQEKHSLIDKVNKAADDATSAIKNATTDNAVKDAETKGLNEINGVTIPTLAEKQQAANVAIDQAAKAKKAEIAKALQAGNIDQAKADSLNTEVDNDVTNAMKAIANATTNAAVVVAQNDGIHKIKAIKVPSSTYNPDIANNTSTGSGDTDSTSTKPAEEATLKLILTHNAYIYNKDYQITYKDNKRVVLKKGTQIIALDNGKKYLIKGKEFYRIGDNQYVKVSNTISYYYLVHNSFLYNKHGKTIKRNGKRILVRKGVRLEANKVKVVKINGKKFYKVGKSTYIKFRNVKLIISPNN